MKGSVPCNRSHLDNPWVIEIHEENRKIEIDIYRKPPEKNIEEKQYKIQYKEAGRSWCNRVKAPKPTPNRSLKTAEISNRQRGNSIIAPEAC